MSKGRERNAPPAAARGCDSGAPGKSAMAGEEK